MFKRIILLALLVLLVLIPATTAQTASITITSPTPGEVVSPGEVVVFGTATAVPENNVVVQALDANGNVLAEQPVTASGEMGGTGDWSASLMANATPGSTGRIRAFSISPADGSVVAEVWVDVTYGAQAVPPIQVMPGIAITSPAPGATVPFGEVAVAGSATAVPGNEVIVQVLDANGSVLAEQPVIVNADLGGTGNWSTVLLMNATPGTNGRIRAFSISPADGSVVAEAAVNIAFAQRPNQARISINIPVPGETISPTQVVVSGTGTALPENNVVVRVLDANRNILAEQATTANAELGGTGNWSATLNYNAPANTPGSIYAFSISPEDGRVIADSLININFGPSAQPPRVTITNPGLGATVNTAVPFVVSGTAANLFENNVIVRVRDAFNRTLREQVTTADVNGNWAVTVDLLIANGTAGNIYAFSTSPADGRIVAESLVNVTFASACQVRTDWPVYTVQRGDQLFSIAQRTGSTVSELTLANCLPNPNQIFPGDQLRVPRLPTVVLPPATVSISITTPDVNGVLPPDAAFSVTGASEGTQLDTIFVRLLDVNGTVLAETDAEATPAAAANTFTWQADFESLDVAAGTRGTVFAYAVSLADARIVASSAVNVSYGAPVANTPFITITSPIPYSSPALGQITVTGRGGGLFEGTVVVQALDDNGRVMAQQPTIIDAPDAGTGGEGNWEVTLNVSDIRRGQIFAFATNAEDGSIMISATLDVVFGDPTTLATYTLLTFPLPNTIITNEQPYVAVAGLANGVFGDNVSVVLLDENGSILRSQAVQVNPATNLWSLTTDANSEIVRERELRMQVIATSPNNGAIIAADAIPVVVRPVGGDNAISGTVSYRPFIALTPGQTVTVQLLRFPDTGEPAVIIGEQVIEIADQQVPVPFSIAYDPAQIDPNASYGLQATITFEDGTLQFTTPQAVPVITRGNPTHNIELLVELAAQ